MKTDKINLIQAQLDKRVETISYGKEIMTLDELASYSGFAKGYIYKLTHKKLIPYYKPLGKKIIFKKSEVDSWLLTNRQATEKEIEDLAAAYTYNDKTFPR